MKKVLIANRGEIALRVLRAARLEGLKTAIVYSEPDSGSLPVRLADERIGLGGSSAKDTYLNQEKLLQAAQLASADLVHPGYGFLAENSEFAAKVESAGLKLVGPSSRVIALMADKDQARKKAQALKVPIVPGTEAGVELAELKRFAEEVGYPVIFKAVAGGSGRGMRIVEHESELKSRWEEAQAEAKSAFSNPAVFLEKFLTHPRHIEVQIFGDGRGKVVHLFERECSVQRRHQKIIEEAPAINLHPEVRKRLFKYATTLAEDVAYESSGTLEFLVDGGREPNSGVYFLEMNTRIQVEHTVTEQITGVDLVRKQLQIALGAKLDLDQSALAVNGHAIQFRVYAENVATNFTPVVGKVLYLSRAGGIGVREDGWAESGTKLSPYYDSLLCKLIVSGKDRTEAIERSRGTLGEFIVEGLETTLGFHRWMLKQPDFLNGDVDVYWISRNYRGETLPPNSVCGPLILPPGVE